MVLSHIHMTVHCTAPQIIPLAIPDNPHVQLRLCQALHRPDGMSEVVSIETIFSLPHQFAHDPLPAGSNASTGKNLVHFLFHSAFIGILTQHL